MDIYLDTMLWNALCDSTADPESLLRRLNGRGARLVFSGHTVYELTKTFRSGATERGCQLFSYFKQFVDADAPCVKDNMELLIAEVDALASGKWAKETFVSATNYDLLRQEVEKLSNGIFDERAKGFVESRREFATNTRSNQAQHLDDRADIKQKLRLIRSDQLETWLANEIATPQAVEMLAGHMLRAFSDAPRISVFTMANDLLRLRHNRMARGIVRADLYYNWRCAVRDSNPKDLVDDMFHVLNATYCDVYATQEAKQSEYAGLLLTSNTRVAIYDGQRPLHDWLAAIPS